MLGTLPISVGTCYHAFFAQSLQRNLQKKPWNENWMALNQGEIFHIERNQQVINPSAVCWRWLRTSRRQASIDIWVNACKQSYPCTRTHEREKTEKLMDQGCCGQSIHQLWMQLTHHIKVEKLPWFLPTFKWQNADIGSRIVNVCQLGEKVVFYKTVSYHGSSAFSPTITGLRGQMPGSSCIKIPYVGLFGLFC